MLSSVLNTSSAIQANIAILRTFIRLRHILAAHDELARQLEDLRWRQHEHGEQIQAIFAVIEKLTEPPDVPLARRIGFPSARRTPLVNENSIRHSRHSLLAIRDYIE